MKTVIVKKRSDAKYFGMLNGSDNKTTNLPAAPFQDADRQIVLLYSVLMDFDRQKDRIEAVVFHQAESPKYSSIASISS